MVIMSLKTSCDILFLFFVRILLACENKHSTEAVVAEADKIVLTMGAKIVFNELFSNTFPFLFS